MAVRPQVFISYQRSDADYAHLVREHLARHGITTWMDQYDIPVGAYWPDAIDQGLTSSDIVVGFLSPDAVASRNVKNEWDWALANDKRLLLLQVRPSVVPHRYISLNFIDATGSDPAPALAALVAALNQGLEGNSARPETHYAQSGDLSIAYQVFGEGPVDLVVTPGAVSNLDWIWDEPRLARYYRRLADFARVITFDKRGTGLSDRTAGVPTLEERIDDLRAVMDAAEVERAVVMGVSQGGSMAIQFAASHPDRTSALILYGTMVRSPTMPPEAQQQADEQTLRTWGRDMRAAVAELAPSMINDAGFMDWFTRYARASASPGAVIALGRMDALIDVRGLLPSLGVPTLVLHRVDDRDVPIEQGRYLAAQIPAAVMVELPGENHLPWVGDQDAIVDAVQSFVTQHVSVS